MYPNEFKASPVFLVRPCPNNSHSHKKKKSLSLLTPTPPPAKETKLFNMWNGATIQCKREARGKYVLDRNPWIAKLSGEKKIHINLINSSYAK